MRANQRVAGGAGGPAVSGIRANLALLAMVLIWGLNFSIAKDALATVHPLAFNTLRFPLAAAVVTGALVRRNGWSLPDPRDYVRVVMLGFLANLIYQLFFIYGLAMTRAGTASVLLAGTPIATALLTFFAGHERVPARVWAGAVATVLGIVLVVSASAPVGAGATNPQLGNLLMVGATLAWATYSVASRDLIHRYGALPVTAWTLWAGTAAVVLIGLPATLRTDVLALGAADWFAVVYAGALSIGVAYVLWSFGVRHMGPTQTATYSNLVPIVALAAAWVLLGERPAPLQLLGAAVIIGGVSFTQRRSRLVAPTVRAPT